MVFLKNSRYSFQYYVISRFFITFAPYLIFTNMKYYIAVNNERQGPFTTEELAQKGITADTLVWTENMVDWQPAGSLDELRPFIRQAHAVPPQVSAPQKKKKSGCMITLLIALIVLALAVGAAALTNPSKETHQKELSGILSEAIKETLKTKNTSGFELDAVYDKVVPRIIENVSNELLDYNNYFVFSTCNLKTDENKRATIGAFGKVYTADKDEVKKVLMDALKNMESLGENLSNFGV